MNDSFPGMTGMVVLIGDGVTYDDESTMELLGARTTRTITKKTTHEYVSPGSQSSSDLPVITPENLKERCLKARDGFEAFLAVHARMARIPVLGSDGVEGLGTRWFGRPCMSASQRWPQGDHGPMNFVAQFSAADIPAGLPGGACGLLLFVEEGGMGDGEDAEVVLIYPGEACVLHDLPEGVKRNAPLYVQSWREVVDHPFLSEEDGLEGQKGVVDLSEELTSTTCGEVTLDNGENLPEAEAAIQALPPLCHTWECDKVGGWPRWEQARDVPKDRKRKPMRFVLQVGYKGLTLGDVDFEAVDWPTWGRGQVFVSQTIGEAKYVWACD